MAEEKIIDRKKIRVLHEEIVNNIKMILDTETLENGEDILLQNSADQIGITKELLQEILEEKEEEMKNSTLPKAFKGIDYL